MDIDLNKLQDLDLITKTKKLNSTQEKFFDSFDSIIDHLKITVSDFSQIQNLSFLNKTQKFTILKEYVNEIVKFLGIVYTVVDFYKKHETLINTFIDNNKLHGKEFSDYPEMLQSVRR